MPAYVNELVQGLFGRLRSQGTVNPPRQLELKNQKSKYEYVYHWGNNEVRRKLKGKKCRVLARGKMNTCMVEFEDGQIYTISRNALKKV